MALLKTIFTVVLEITIFHILYSNSITIGNIGGSIGGSKTITKNVVIRINKPNFVPIPVPTVSPTPTTAPTPAVTTIPKNTTGSVIQTGIGCGTKYLNPRDVLRIESHNFDQVTPYPPNDSCIWKFIAKECTISVQCPCFDVPPSFDCFGDYLKILDLPFYHQKFCGSTKPQGVYRASTEVFALKFRSDSRISGRGFVCYVQCTGVGDADQLTPDRVRDNICPNFQP